MDFVLGRLGILEIDPVDLEKGEVALAFLRVGAADLAFDGVSGAERKAADLRGRDINVVGTSEIVGIRRAQEAEAVLKNLDDAGADDLDVLRSELLQCREHQLLFAHGAGVLDAGLFGEAQ